MPGKGRSCRAAADAPHTLQAGHPLRRWGLRAKSQTRGSPDPPNCPPTLGDHGRLFLCGAQARMFRHRAQSSRIRTSCRGPSSALSKAGSFVARTDIFKGPAELRVIGSGALNAQPQNPQNPPNPKTRKTPNPQNRKTPNPPKRENPKTQKPPTPQNPQPRNDPGWA